MNIYNISRQEWAQKIEVSTKSIDRYIKQGILPAQKIGGKVYLNENDLINIKKNSPKRGRRKKLINTSTKESKTNTTPNINNNSTDSFFSNLNNEKNFSWKIYNDLKKELVEKDQILLASNYRIGELENKLKNSIPLIEIQNKDQEINQIKIKQQQEITSLHQKIQTETFNRYIYLIIILFLLIIEIVFWFLV